jgi:hypothetical protein
MKNGNTEHDLDSIAQLLRRQNAVLDVLLRHLAWSEATLGALTLKTLSDENLSQAKAMKDYIQPMIYDEMIAEIERKLDKL